MSTRINQTVLMSGTSYFGVEELNPYSSKEAQPHPERSRREHDAIREALIDAGIDVIKVDEPEGCQDGVYTANWGLCRGDTVVLSALPNMRQAEAPSAEEALRELGKKIIRPPEGVRFSGQGDALPCGNLLLCGTSYRTDLAVHAFLAETLGYEVISLQTVPALNNHGQPMINKVTGWPDSFFYDIDLALSIISPDLIAWCPEAFTPSSQRTIRNLTLDKIEVSLSEAREGFACNLVSTGETVIMSAHAPQLQASLEARGLRTITPEINELAKGGGYIRCTTLTVDN